MDAAALIANRKAREAVEKLILDDGPITRSISEDAPLTLLGREVPPEAANPVIIVELCLPDGHVARLTPEQLDDLRRTIGLLSYPFVAANPPLMSFCPPVWPPAGPSVWPPAGQPYVPPPDSTGTPLPPQPTVICHNTGDDHE